MSRKGKPSSSTKKQERIKSIDPAEVKVYYKKSRQFRVIHVDGVIGNILPSGRALNVALYSERLPFPQKDIFKIGPDGFMIAPQQGAGKRKKGFFREIEISGVMDWQTAKSLADWLGRMWPILKLISEKGTGNDGNTESKSDARERKQSGNS